MEKEFIRKQKLKQMSEVDRKKAEEEHLAQIQKHKDHPKVPRNFLLSIFFPCECWFVFVVNTKT